MKKQILLMLMGFAIACLLFGSTAMGQDTMHGCSKIENGQLRIVSDPNQCLQSEYAVILTGKQAGALEFDVDCDSGETVSSFLGNAPHAGALTIRVHGVCREEVYIARDDVSIRGVTQGAGFEAPTDDSHILTLDGARRINLFHLTITGGREGIYAINGASFRAFDVAISEASINGLDVGFGASGSIENSTISHCKFGIGVSGSLHIHNTIIEDIEQYGVHGGSFSLAGGSIVQRCGAQAVLAGSSVSICGAEIQDNVAGVWALDGGSVDISCADTIIRRNNSGVTAYAGHVTLRDGAQVIENYGSGVVGAFNGTVRIGGVVVSNNLGSGVLLEGGSSANIAGGTVISSNAGDGVFLADTSVASFWNIEDGQISNNGGYGIYCAVSPSVAQIQINDPGFVTGNTLGQINCP